MKTFLRKLIFYILAKSGFYVIWNYLNRRSIVILTIHGVMDAKEKAQWIPTRPQVSIEQLEESIKLIQKHYTFITMAEAISMLSGTEPLRENCVVVTFDDGYRNNLTHAWPILRSYKVPGIVFVAVGAVDGRECFWFDRLDYAVQQYVASGGRDIQLGDERIQIDASTRDRLRTSIKSIIFKIKGLSGSEAETMAIAEKTIAGLEQLTGKSLNDLVETDPWCGVMSWDDVKAAGDSGLHIGSHTIGHARLSRLNESEIRWQLAESKRKIEDSMGQSCDFFCYPNGSYNQDAPGLVREAGYSAAVTVQEGINYPGADLYQLKRLHLPQGQTPEESLAVTSGFSWKLSLLLKYLRGMGMTQHA
jgi:peptidoglycan/xylan/chitin deacetylase (PgdA/CDA1 family)